MRTLFVHAILALPVIALSACASTGGGASSPIVDTSAPPDEATLGEPELPEASDDTAASATDKDAIRELEALLKPIKSIPVPGGKEVGPAPPGN